MLSRKEKKSPSKSKSAARSVGAMSSSIADRTDAAVILLSKFIIEDNVEVNNYKVFGCLCVCVCLSAPEISGVAHLLFIKL